MPPHPSSESAHVAPFARDRVFVNEGARSHAAPAPREEAHHGGSFEFNGGCSLYHHGRQEQQGDERGGTVRAEEEGSSQAELQAGTVPGSFGISECHPSN